MLALIGNKFVKRGISLFLVLTFVLSFFGSYAPTAQAEDVGTLASAPQALSSLAAGSVIHFAGYQWIVLDPSQGLLLMRYAYGDPRPFDTGVSGTNETYNPSVASDNSGNIGYLLNGTFLSSMTETDRSRIIAKNWYIGSQVSNTGMVCEVGLLNKTQVGLYADILMNNPLLSVEVSPSPSPTGESTPGGWWTSTWYQIDGASTWTSGISGNYYINDSVDEVVETTYSTNHFVRPAIYLSASTLVLDKVVIAPQNEILSFSVGNQIGSSVFDTTGHTITFAIPSTVNVASIAPSITVSGGATISPAIDVAQDFSSSVEYLVTSVDGLTQWWTVNCQVLNVDANITSFSVNGITASINPANHSVYFVVPADTNVASLSPSIAVSNGATIGVVNGSSVTSLPDTQNFTSPVTYRVTAAAGNTQDWTATCEKAVSQVTYKVEHYLQNLSGDGYTLQDTDNAVVDSNTTVTATPKTYTGFKENQVHSERIASGLVTESDTLVMRIYYDRNLFSLQYEENGGSPMEDVSAIRYGTVINEPMPPAREGYRFDGWYSDEALTTPYVFSQPVTKNATLYAKWVALYKVSYRESDGTLLSDVTLDSGTVFEKPTDPAKDGYSFMGWYLEPALETPYGFGLPLVGNINLYASFKCSGKDILDFYVLEQVQDSCNIDTDSHTVVFHVPYGTEVTGLRPQMTVSVGATLSPADDAPVDFTNPVTYTVTSESNATQTWTVTCVVDPNTANDISGFTVTGQVGDSDINATLHTVIFHVPYDTNVIALQPQLTISAKASATPANNAAVDFTNPVTYTVTSESNATQTWTVTCVVDPNTANDVSGFIVSGQVGSSIINATQRTVIFHMPYGTNVTALQPQLTISEKASVAPSSNASVDFTNPVTYEVTSQSNAKQNWSVTCVVNSNTENDITSFSVPGQVGDSVIDTELHTVTFHVTYGTLISALQPQLTISVKAAVSPTNSATVNFTNPAAYTVTSQSGTPQVWTVTCIVEKNPANDIVSYTVPGQIGSSEINPAEHTVVFYILPGTSLAELTPVIGVSNDATIKPQSGITPSFVNGSAVYTVTAETGAAQIWIVSYRIFYVPAQQEMPKTPETPQEKLEEAVTSAKETVSVQTATGSAVSVGSKSAVLVGTITAGGGDDIQIGFRYRVVGESNWSYTAVQVLALQDGQGFSAEVKVLKPKTVYEFEARAANSMGMSEGRILTFTTEKAKTPKVQTLDAETEDLGKVQITGVVLDDGGDAVKDAGFLWGDSPGNLKKQRLDTAMQLSCVLTDLKVGSTLYFQAYAVNSSGIATGELRSFKVPGLIVTTLQATEITKDGATLQGKITGSDKILESGFTISPGSGSALRATSDKDGNFKVEVRGLKSGTKYYFVAYAKTVEKEYSGQVMEFTPQSDFPEVETYAAKDVGQIMGNLGGYITKNKGYPILDSGFYWGQDPNPDRQVSVSPADDIRTLAFRLVGLKANTTYYFKAYATNKKGIGYGETLSFTTAEATKPVILTSSAAFDKNNKQWVMVGRVENNGGTSLSEYGFRLTEDQENWTDLPIGFDILGDYVSRGLPIFRDLQPGAYSVKAYAVNSAGYGEGEVRSILVPALPKVKTILNQDTIDLNKVTLQASITDTGAAGAFCYFSQFKFKKAGDKDWQTVGKADGNFGVSDFSFELTGLTPGLRYEFMAETENSYGSASGDVLSFTMNYGKTTQQAIAYLKGAGKAASEIAGILKTTYQCSLDECVLLLYQNQYAVSDIAAAIKASVYQANHRDLATALKKVGAAAQELTQALLASYKTPMQISGNGLESELITILKVNGFNLVEIIRVMTSNFAYDSAKCIRQFSSFYPKNEIYGAVTEVLGFDPLIKHLWAQGVNWMNSSVGWGQLFQVLYETVVIMRDTGKLEPIAVGEKMRELYPQLTALQLATAFYASKYPASQAIPVVAQLYGADPSALAATFSKTSYSKYDLTRCFIQDLGYPAVQMVQIVTSVYKNWKDPKEGCAFILQDYYKLDAVESAKIMYAAGWTENINDSKGYGLGQLIYTMKENYGQTSDYALMGILKGLGISPLEVALRIGGKSGWMKDYRAQGYSATDAASWVKVDWAKYGLHSQLGITVRFCDEANYDLVDIALALRTVFNTDMQTALKYFLANTKKDTKQISEALTKAYGENPILNAIKAMAGYPIKNIASALRNTYNVIDPDTAADYLVQAQYSTTDIIRGLAEIYFEVKTGPQFASFLEFVRKKLPDAAFADILNAVIRKYGNEPSATTVTSMLTYLGYDIKTTAKIQSEEYKLSLPDVLDAMLYQFGRMKEPEYTPIVMTAYGLNLVSYIEYEKNRGFTAIRNAKLLVEVFKIATVEETASALAKAKYDKQSVVDAILQVYYSGHLSPEAVATLEKIIKANFVDSVGDMVKTLLRNGEVRPISQAIRALNSGGYSLEAIAQALKDIYTLSEDQVYNELSAVNLFSLNDITVVLQGIYGQDFVTMMIKIWKQQPWGNAENIYRELKRVSGITDPAILFKYMRYAGIPEEETMYALYRDVREGMVSALKTVYGIKDAIGMGTLLGRFRKPGEFDLYDRDFAAQLVAVFPGTTHYQIVKAFQAYGYPVEQGGSSSITGWLRTYSGDGIHDDKLAEFLGKNNGGLNLPVHTAAEILQGKGYVVQDAAYWLIQCGYDWKDFYKQLVYRYAPSSYPTSYYENNSAAKFIARYLKDYYDIKDIARGEFGYWGSSGGVLADLISGGYTLDQSIYATLWIGGDAAGHMVVTVVDNSISRANAARDQSLRLNGVDAANKVFDITLAVAYDKRAAGIAEEDPICLEDIAKSLVKYGPAAGYSRYFSHWEVLEAMETLTGKYLSMAGLGLPVREAALATLRMAGTSPSDAAEMLASHKVGLSTTSVVKSFFGLGNDWFDAVTALAGAGYSFSDSISAVYNNSSYHTIIGISVLSAITTSAIGALSASANVGTYISIIKEVAKTGFKIGEGTLTLDDVLKYNPMYLQYKYTKKLVEYVPSH